MTMFIFICFLTLLLVFECGFDFFNRCKSFETISTAISKSFVVELTQVVSYDNILSISAFLPTIELTMLL